MATVTAAGEQAPPAPKQRARWLSVFFAPVGDGERRRRGSDGLRVAAAVLALLCIVVSIRYSSHFDEAVTHVLNPAPTSISWLVTFVYDVGVYVVTALLVALALAARRWEVARDIGCAAGGALAVSGLMILFLGDTGGRAPTTSIDGYDLSFPVLAIALLIAVTTAALPYLSRAVQRVIECSIVLIALASVVGGHGLPTSVLGSLAIGWGATAAVHLVFGSPLGLLSPSEVAGLLFELGVPVTDIRSIPGQVWGVAKFSATGPPQDGAAPVPLSVSVYGRDASEARLLAKSGRFLFYRDSGPTLTFTRLQQVEREAYLTMWASRAHVDVPEVVAVGIAGPSHDAAIVFRPPPGRPLSALDGDDVSDAALDSIYRQLLRMREARLAHGAVSGESILVDASGHSALVDFRNATSNADAHRLDGDLAGATAAIAVAVGAERAAAAADRNLDADVLAGTLQRLRRAGLDPALTKQLRGQKSLLDEVRQDAAGAKSIEVPKLVEPRRISWPTLVIIFGSLIGGWALLNTLLNVAGAFETILGAEWAWVVLVFIFAQLAFVSTAVEDLGSVSGVLPFGPAVALEFANSFTALAGGTPAKFGTRVRFFQQQGYDPSVAVSSGAVVTSVSWLVKGLLIVVSIPFAWGTFRGHIDLSGSSKVAWIVLIVIVLVGVAVGVLVAVPRLRRLAAGKVKPRVSKVWTDFRSVVATPRKIVQVVGGSLAGELAVAFSLAASLRAFGDHLGLATVILTISFAALLGGVSPVPGGMGVVEAGMILGLTAAGISEQDATAAVFIQRLFSAYLPPIWGWFTLVWMRKHEYV